MMDRVASAGLFALLATCGVGWLALSRARFERVERGGAGLLGLGSQNAAYWAIQPIGKLLARTGVSANAVTLASVPFALGAAVAFARGHFGVGAWLAAACFACDALDGLVARATNTASDAGEILDAAVDRVCEALIFGGLTIAWRDSVPSLAVVLVAALAAQQVTLASAKSELHPRAKVPRGWMRRAERAALVVLGAAATGLFDTAAPLVVALSIVAIVGNASAVHRFFVLASALRPRRPAQHTEEVPHAAE